MIKDKLNIANLSSPRLLLPIIIAAIIFSLFGCDNGEGDSGASVFARSDKSSESFVYRDSILDFDIEIGAMNSANNQPAVTLSKRHQICNLSVQLPRTNDCSGMSPVDGGRTLEYAGSVLKNRFYMLSPVDFEWEIILAQKPDSNSLRFAFKSDNLIFYYQDPEVFKAHENDFEFNENIPGSYAVYYDSPGADKFDTGKAFHIYRPYATDQSGDKVWCDLWVDTLEEIISITIPREFLESAKYPVAIDPTFGCTTRGATGVHMETYNFRHQVNYGGHQAAVGFMQTAHICGFRTSESAACTASVAVYTYNASLDSCQKVGISAKIPITKFATGPDSAEWFTGSISGSLETNKEYIVSWQGRETCNYCLRICADYTGQWGYERRSNYSDWGTNNNLAGYQSNGYRYSVYIDYQDSVVQGNPYVRVRRIKRSG